MWLYSLRLFSLCLDDMHVKRRDASPHKCIQSAAVREAERGLKTTKKKVRKPNLARQQRQ